jgi:hypothetical protein
MAGEELTQGLGRLWKIAPWAMGGLAVGSGVLGQVGRQDPTTGQPEPGAENLAGGAGSLAGGIAGGVAGTALLGPWGGVAGSWLGSELGGGLARGGAQAISGLLEPSPLEKQIRDGVRMNEALRAERMKAIPVTEAEGLMNNRLEADRMNSALGAQRQMEQQRALLAAALAGSARPLPGESYAQALAGAGTMFGGF